MKYIDAEKLIAEIERMREINKKAFMAEHITADVFHGRTQAINHIFGFINSLQQEQPEVDLVKEIDKVWNNGLSDELAGPHNIFNICARLARHFYELGKRNARKEVTK